MPDRRDSRSAAHPGQADDQRPDPGNAAANAAVRRSWPGAAPPPLQPLAPTQAVKADHAGGRAQSAGARDAGQGELRPPARHGAALRDRPPHSPARAHRRRVTGASGRARRWPPRSPPPACRSVRRRHRSAGNARRALPQGSLRPAPATAGARHRPPRRGHAGSLRATTATRFLAVAVAGGATRRHADPAAGRPADRGTGATAAGAGALHPRRSPARCSTRSSPAGSSTSRISRAGRCSAIRSPRCAQEPQAAWPPRLHRRARRRRHRGQALRHAARHRCRRSTRKPRSRARRPEPRLRCGTPGAAGLPDAAPALVRQQLDVLETGQILWRGDLWPGQRAAIEIVEDDASRDPRQPPAWRTRLALTLPGLGAVEARLALAGTRLHLHLVAADTTRATVLRDALPELAAALAARGARRRAGHTRSWTRALTRGRPPWRCATPRATPRR